MELSESQVESFFHDGYVVLPSVIPPELVLQARRDIYRGVGTAWTALSRKDGDPAAADEVRSTGTSPSIRALFNDTGLRELLESSLATPVPTAQAGQIALLFPGNAVNQSNPKYGDTGMAQCGYPGDSIPWWGWSGHLDGQWAGGCVPPDTPEDQVADDRYSFANPKKQTFGADPHWYADPSTNGSPLHPSEASNLANFTVLVGVALSDQTTEGCGNLGLLRGGWKVVNDVLYRQHIAGGPMGPEDSQGGLWPREDVGAANGHGLRHMPDAVREAFKEDAARTPDGKLWPRPTLMQISAGDVVLVLHQTPHCATRNLEGYEPRAMIYFRVTSSARAAGEEKVCISALLDPWVEWKGLHRQLETLGLRQHATATAQSTPKL